MLNPSAAVTSGIARLQTALTASKTIAFTDAQLTDIKTLRAALDERTALPRINIVGAWYGDVNDIGEFFDLVGPYKMTETRRFCTATQAMRTLCHAKTYCYDTPVAAGADDLTKQKAKMTGLGAAVIGESLCGYDPAPYADKSVKGLVVAYQCIEQSDAYWRDQTLTPPLVIWPPEVRRYWSAADPKSPGYRPPPATATGPTDKVYGTVVRANTIGDIRCYQKDLPQ
jgi:hypothetical protein